MGFNRTTKNGDEKCALGEVDRLSGRILDLIHCIMGCLRIGDASKMYIVLWVDTKKFSHCWKGTPVVKFDEQFYKDLIERKDRQFHRMVESVMALVNGPIDELRIHFPPSDKNVKMLDDGSTSRFLTLPFHVYNPSHLSKLSFKYRNLKDPLFSKCEFSSLVSLIVNR